MATNFPLARPARPYFSSGPCAKHPGWQLEYLKNAPFGRSHRSKAGKSRLKLAIDLTREVLQVPPDYRIGIIPGSDTGAVEAALWSLLGPRGVDVFGWESFSKHWVEDVVEHLKIPNARAFVAGYGELPGLSRADFRNDVVFAWIAPPLACGSRVPAWSARTVKDSPFAMRPRPPSRKDSTGQSSTPPLSLGKRPLAAKPRTGCSFSRRARSSGFKPIPRPGRCQSFSGWLITASLMPRSSRARRSTRRLSCASRIISTRSTGPNPLAGFRPSLAAPTPMRRR